MVLINSIQALLLSSHPLGPKDDAYFDRRKLCNLSPNHYAISSFQVLAID